MDFYHAGARLCVEVDGGYHRPGRDGRRDRVLAYNGIVTLRFSNRRALTSTMDVTLEVARVALALLRRRVAG